jgi:hypothetical protein
MNGFLRACCVVALSVCGWAQTMTVIVYVPTNSPAASASTLTVGWGATSPGEAPRSYVGGAVGASGKPFSFNEWGREYYYLGDNKLNPAYCWILWGGVRVHPSSVYVIASNPGANYYVNGVTWDGGGVPDVLTTNWCRSVVLTNTSAVRAEVWVNWQAGTNYATQTQHLWPGEVCTYEVCCDVAVPEFLGSGIGSKPVEVTWDVPTETVVTNGVGGIEGPYAVSSELPDAGVWSDNPTDFGSTPAITTTNTAEAISQADQRARDRAAAQIQAGAQSTAAVTEGLGRIEGALTNAPGSVTNGAQFVGTRIMLDGSGIAARVPSLTVPTGQAPQIVLPYAAIGYGLADVPFDFSTPALVSVAGVVRAFLASLMFLGYIMMMFRLIGRGAGV